MFCLFLTLAILPAQYKDPINIIMSYPPKIRQRVEELPQYKGTIKQREKAHVGKKIFGLIFFVIILSGVAYLSGCRSFSTTFIHVFILFLVVNIYDLIVLDWGIFCHSKKLRISSTEDMEKEYKDYMFLVFGQIKLFGMGMSMLRLASASIDRTLQTEKMEQMDEKGKAFSPKEHGIEFNNVHFSYENKEILHGIDVVLPDKTTTAVIGPSGSGKTTLCNLIARFWDVDSGSVKIGGKDVWEYTLESLMEQISMVFQNVYLFADTIENNIKFGRPQATHAEVVEAARKACCADFIEVLPDGYDTIIGEGGSSLSGGEKQRISIARAMLKDAPIVILDDCEIIGLTRRNPIKSRVLPC